MDHASITNGALKPLQRHQFAIQETQLSSCTLLASELASWLGVQATPTVQAMSLVALPLPDRDSFSPLGTLLAFIA